MWKNVFRCFRKSLHAERCFQAGGLENRSNYEATWEQLAVTFDRAKVAVTGRNVPEDELDGSGSYTVDILDRLVGINPSDIFLEIGCGVGRVGKILSARCLKWIGTDISSRMLRYAAQRLNGLENVGCVPLILPEHFA